MMRYETRVTDYRDLGLFTKYAYERVDGKPLDDGEEVFSLRFDKDDAWGQACRWTLRDFADRIEGLGYVQLANDLRKRLDAIEQRIRPKQKRFWACGRCRIIRELTGIISLYDACGDCFGTISELSAEAINDLTEEQWAKLHAKDLAAWQALADREASLRKKDRNENQQQQS